MDSKQKPTQRQEQILNAALEAFARKGYAAATVPEIAQAAGVAIGTIYIYHPSKRELFLAVIRNLLITVPLLNLFQEMSADQFPVIFKGIIQNRLTFIEGGNTARLLSLMGEIQRDPELKAMYLEQLIQPIMSKMEAFYRDQIESGRFRQLDPAVVVRGIGGMIIGLAILKVLEGADSPLDQLPQEKVADDLLNLVFYGLANQDRKTGAKQENSV
jgi:AcrR family transcriptional regulator